MILNTIARIKIPIIPITFTMVCAVSSKKKLVIKDTITIIKSRLTMRFFIELAPLIVGKIHLRIISTDFPETICL